MNLSFKLILYWFLAATTVTAYCQTAPLNKNLNDASDKPPLLESLTSPLIIRGDEHTAFRDPLIFREGDTFYMFYSYVREEEDHLIYWYVAFSKSKDLVNWTEPEVVTPKGQDLNFASPGNVFRVGNEWMLSAQTYPIIGMKRGDPLRFNNDSARLWLFHSKDIENWGNCELIRVKGPDMTRAELGKMIDPFIFRDRDIPGKWWCLFKQSAWIHCSWSYDLKTWHMGTINIAQGENGQVFLDDNGEYVLIYAPANGIGVKRSRDLVHWRDEPTILLGQEDWPWCEARLTGGYVADFRKVPGVGKYLMVWHSMGPGTVKTDANVNANCNIGVAWSDDLKTWSWPGKEVSPQSRQEQQSGSTTEYYTVDLSDENIRIPPTVKPLFDQFMRDTYCTLGPDGWYYLTGTTPAPGRTNIWDWNDGLRLWRSKDLKKWEDMGLVFSLDRDGTWQKPFIDVPPGRITPSGEVCDSIQRIAWTPEIHYIKSKNTWLINACMGSKVDPRRGAFILKSISGKPEGPYENIEASRNGPINNLPGNFSADNSLFEDDDGTVYFVGVDHYVMKMKDDLSGFAENPHTLIETPWKNEHCEGGFIFKHGGRYHLVQTFWSRKRQPDRLEYSQSLTLKPKKDSSIYSYDAIVSSSDNIYGPYGKRYTAVIGGGHLNPFQDAKGLWWGAAFGNPRGQSEEVNSFDGKTLYNCRPLLIPLKWENDQLMVDRSLR
jgi:Glycosyl hydrolases family 43